MRTLAPLAAIILDLAAPPAAAQSPDAGRGAHGAHGDAPMAMQAGPTHPGVGVVHRVDADKGMVNLTHEPMPSLKWPQMTMDLEVADRALLRDLRPDMRVEFELGRKRGGGYAITAIRERR